MLPPQVSLVAPTGTTPRASAWSWSLQPRVATRFGSFSMVVLPKACSMVTGKASASALVLELADSLSESVEPVRAAGQGEGADGDAERQVAQGNAGIHWCPSGPWAG